ncbi:MAG: hypothetical protein V4563_15055 [Pseudomonadota bacterium]
MSDGKFILVGVGGALVVGVAAYILLKKMGGSIAKAIPQVVKDGAEATGQLGAEVGRIVTNPLNEFGVTPGTFADGTPKWEPTAPVLVAEGSETMVNPDGMDFRNF